MSELYGSNSIKSRTQTEKPKPSVSKIVKGNVTQKAGRSFFKEFFQKDAGEIWEYLIYDVLLPKSKDVMFDLVDNGISMLIYGDGRGAKKKSPTGAYVSYNSYSSANKPVTTSSVQRRSDVLQEIIFDRPEDAEDVLNALLDIIEVYDMCKVSDLYELAGLSTTSTDSNYGWKNLGSAKTKRVREGYILDLPRPVVLD